MALQIKKAKRSQTRIKIAIGGPAGSGKTMSSILLAYGLIKAEHPDWSDEACWEKICVIDTENGSGSLYVGTNVSGTQIGEYLTIDMAPPFDPQSFIDAIDLAERHDMEVIIIDSLSHAWVGEGGALDKQGAIAARSGNSYTAWRSVTPLHNKLVDKMLQSKCHVIADIRAKMDYEQTVDEKGKKQVKAIGMGLQMRDGIEYEFTVSFMLDYDHNANATKDRTGMFDGLYFRISPKTGASIYRWLASGAAPKEDPKSEPQMKKAAPPVSEPVVATAAMEEPAPAAPVEADPFATPDMPEMETAVPEAPAGHTIAELDACIRAYIKGKTPEQVKAIGAKVAEIAGTKNYKEITDQAMIERLWNMFNK